MSNYITKHHHQAITHWVRGEPDGWGGYAFATPVPLTGRWIEKQELFINQAGQEEKSQAVVLLGTDVSVGDYLYLGTSAVALPKNVTGVCEVKAFKKIPNLKATDYVRKAWL